MGIAENVNQEAGSGEAWKPVQGRIMTRWAGEVSPDNAWPEYPRPAMIRPRWKSLNGLWDYAIQGEEGEWQGGRVVNADYDPLSRVVATPPAQWDGKILVPFAVESALSGVGRLVRPHQLLWYRRRFDIPQEWSGQRILLHFEAVDWHAVVWINGSKVGEHKGGYTPFTFDVTKALRPGGPQEVVVAVWDPTNMGDQAVGKQSLPEMRRGYRYTPTTGIWQTVWLEPVPEVSIERLKIVPDIDNQSVTVYTILRGEAARCLVHLEVYDGQSLVAAGEGTPGQPVRLAIANPRLWSPHSPFLYDLKVALRQEGTTVDEVGGYFGMRKVSLGKDHQGITRIMLNNQPVFQFGPLDQGYWPDGVLTPPTDEAARFDVQYLKDIGCNMARVHVKVHPARWYYHCDRLGLLVWQDMVCTRKFESNITPLSAWQWQQEQRQMIDHLYNHPSIVTWIVFNEGWGQYDTERLTAWTMDYDPTRLATNASGWTDYDVGHIYDIHDYSFHPSVALAGQFSDRAVVLGECGGFDVIIPGHMWHPNQDLQPSSDPVREQGREKYATAKEWEERYVHWLEGLRLLQPHGLCAAVYTQIADVEHEPNGWLTYDRLSKIDTATLSRWHSRLYQEPLRTSTLSSTSNMGMQQWHYFIGDNPGDRWFDPEVDVAWAIGEAPFGNTSGQPAVNTRWEKDQIFLRKRFVLERVPQQLALRVLAVGAVDIYLNGQLVKKLGSHDPRARYVHIADIPLLPEAREVLHTGENLMAICCGESEKRFVDVELIAVGEA